jgi:transposase
MRRAGVSKPSVWRWQRRFMEAGVDALLHDKTRKPGKAPVPEPIVAQLVERTVGAPPGETTHWTSRAMADVMGLAISTVQKIWRVLAQGCQAGDLGCARRLAPRHHPRARRHLAALPCISSNLG